MSKPARVFLLAAAMSIASLRGMAFADPATITFDVNTPAALTVGASSPVSVDQGFSLTATGISNTSLAVIDNGATPPDQPYTPGDLASQQCLAGLCASNGTNAAYVFRSGGILLTPDVAGTFSVTSFDAAIASNALSRATRIEVDGISGGIVVVSETFLLLPSGYGGGPDEGFPADAASGAAEYFQTLNLDGFTNLAAVSFNVLGSLPTDPAPLTNDWGFLPEFAVDNINVNFTASASQSVPEPTAAALFLTGLLGIMGVRLKAYAYGRGRPIT